MTKGLESADLAKREGTDKPVIQLAPRFISPKAFQDALTGFNNPDPTTYEKSMKALFEHDLAARMIVGAAFALSQNPNPQNVEKFKVVAFDLGVTTAKEVPCGRQD